MTAPSSQMAQVIREAGEPGSPACRNLRAVTGESPALLRQMSAICPELERAMRDVAPPTSEPDQNAGWNARIKRRRSMPSGWKRGMTSLLAGCVLSACSIAGPAAPPSPTASSPTHQTKGNSMSTSSRVPGAPRDAAELLQRTLALIDALHRPEDLTPERVTQFIGPPMTHDDDPKDDDDYYYANHQLTDMWQVRLSRGLHYETKLPYLGLGFDETEKYKDPRNPPPMTEVCQFDMAQFHDALLKLGIQQVGNTRGSTLARQYRRYPVYLNVGYVGESDESLEKLNHKCVSSIYVTFDAAPQESKQ